ARERLAALGVRLPQAGARRLADLRQRLTQAGQALTHLNPQHTLARGYAIVRDAAGGVVSDAPRLRPGSDLRLRFARGSADARVLRTHADAADQANHGDHAAPSGRSDISRTD